MNAETKAAIQTELELFRLPRYQEIPNVGLYLEQCCKYMEEYLSPLGDYALTPSMVSNYVKRGLIASPVRKQYGREQLAYLLFIAVAKNVLSLDGLAELIALQKRTNSLEKSYDFFCQALEGLVRFVFELADTVDVTGEDSSDEKRLLYTCVAAVAQKVFLEKSLAAIAQEARQGEK